MRARTFLEALRRLPLCSPETFLADRSLVVLAPHPDDESLGVGGLIAAACSAGVRVDIVTLTDGAGSHPRSSLFPRDRLVALRKAEAAAAAACLGVAADRLHALDLPDTKTPTAGPAFVDAVDRLADIVGRVAASTVLVTWDRDMHCDHESAALMARALRIRDPHLSLWSYPIWGWHLPPDAIVDEAEPYGWRIDISDFARVKQDAIAAHASQMTDLIQDDPEGFRFDPLSLAPFLQPFEVVFAVQA